MNLNITMLISTFILLQLRGSVQGVYKAAFLAVHGFYFAVFVFYALAVVFGHA